MDDFGVRATACIPRLRRYARALTGDTREADDLVQDTLERALVKRHLWREGSDLRAWMFTIMHNVFVNQVRSRASESRLREEGEPDVETPDRALDLLNIGDMDAALRKLPVDQREVLLLVALEDMSYLEAACALDIPVGTVMSRLFRARERLRVLMGHETAANVLKVVK